MAKDKKVGVHGTDTETGRNGGTKCPISFKQFQDHAKPVVLEVAGQKVVLSPKPDRAETKSFGYFAGEKIVIDIDGIPVKVQLGINATVIGSKDAADK
jgi:hypothetical protein